MEKKRLNLNDEEQDFISDPNDIEPNEEDIKNIEEGNDINDYGDEEELAEYSDDDFYESRDEEKWPEYEEWPEGNSVDNML